MGEEGWFWVVSDGCERVDGRCGRVGGCRRGRFWGRSSERVGGVWRGGSWLNKFNFMGKIIRV